MGIAVGSVDRDAVASWRACRYQPAEDALLNGSASAAPPAR